MTDADMDRDNVLFGLRGGKYGRGYRLTLIAAPLEIDEKPLFARGVYGRWDPIEDMWSELASEISAELTARAQAAAEHYGRLTEAAQAGDKDAMTMLALRGKGSTHWEPVTWKPGGLYDCCICRHCGNAMLRYDANVEYCSTKCRREHGRERKRNWARDNPDKRPSRAKLPEYAPTCASCGATFEASRSDARYCSAACRQRARRNVKNTLALGVDVD